MKSWIFPLLFKFRAAIDTAFIAVVLITSGAVVFAATDVLPSTVQRAPAQQVGNLLVSQGMAVVVNAYATSSLTGSTATQGETADDFVVPAPGWSITSVQVRGNFVPGTANVKIYADGGGFPGGTVCSNAGALVTGGGAFLPFTFTVDISASPCTLAAGTYWIQVDSTNGGTLYVATANVNSGVALAKYRDHPSSGNACSGTWTDLAVCAPLVGARINIGPIVSTSELNGMPFALYGSITPGIIVTPTSVAVSEAGATATYTIAAQSTPTGTVNIPVSTNGECLVDFGGGFVANGTITLPASTTPVTVTVAAVDDVIVDGTTTCTITHGDPTSADAGYNALTAVDVADVTATVADNDFAGVAVTPTVISITEDGLTTATYTLSTTSAPTSTVSVPISTDGQCEVDFGAGYLTTGTVTLPASVIGSTTVTVRGIEDLVAEGPHTCVITHGDPTSADAGYNALTAVDVANVTANVADNDVVGIFSNELGGVAVVEGGATDTYEIVLGSQPSVAVDVIAQPDAQCDLGNGPGNPLTLSFTTTNYNTPQVVTVTAVDDTLAEGPHTCVFTHMGSGADPAYSGFVGPVVTASITDNDIAGLIFSPTNLALSAQTGVLSATYSVQLAAQPATGTTVTINLTFNNTVLTVSVAQLTFTDANWNVPQQVTVTLIPNSGANAVENITHQVTSGDPSYNGLSVALTVTIGSGAAWAPDCAFTDERLNDDYRWDCAPPAVVYCNGGGVDVYGVNTVTSEGYLLLRISAAKIAAVGVPTGENVTIAQAPGVIISRLTTGELQMNSWYYDPYWPGNSKPYIIIWNGCPMSQEANISPITPG